MKQQNLYSIIWAAAVLLGCQGAPPPSATAKAAPTSVAPAPIEEHRVPPPDFETQSRIAIFTINGVLRVGDSYDQARRVFPASMAYESNEIPKVFGPPYRARIWNRSSESCGTILFNDRVALVLYRLERASQDKLRDILELHETALSGVQPEVVAGPRANYWFWEEAGRRLMICAFQRQAGDLQITVAMGDVNAMHAINASIPHANRVQRRLTELLEGSPSQPPLDASHGVKL